MKLPPASPPAVVEEGEMGKGEIRVRESVERERCEEERRKTKEEKEEEGCWLGFKVGLNDRSFMLPKESNTDLSNDKSFAPRSTRADDRVHARRRPRSRVNDRLKRSERHVVSF